MEMGALSPEQGMPNLVRLNKAEQDPWGGIGREENEAKERHLMTEFIKWQNEDKKISSMKMEG